LVQIGNQHRRTLLREKKCAGAAYARRATRDDRYFVPELHNDGKTLDFVPTSNN
jgi:hypothetical protein